MNIIICNHSNDALHCRGNVEFSKKQQNLATLTQNTFYLEIINNVIIENNTKFFCLKKKRSFTRR